MGSTMLRRCRTDCWRLQESPRTHRRPAAKTHDAVAAVVAAVGAERPFFGCYGEGLARVTCGLLFGGWPLYSYFASSTMMSAPVTISQVATTIFTPLTRHVTPCLLLFEPDVFIEHVDPTAVSTVIAVEGDALEAAFGASLVLV